MYVTPRKLKRTKQEQLRLIENMNRDALEKLMNQQVGIVEQINELLNVILTTQKALFVLTETLKQKRIVNELELQTVSGAIEEFKNMESKALIIDPNRKDEPEPNGG